MSAENTNRELKLSPKKQAIAKCSTNLQAKLSHVRKTASPNTKKMTLGVCKSPNNKKTVSSIPSVSPNAESGCSFHLIQESNSVQTAKKLKRFLETSEQVSQSNPISDASKRTNIVGAISKTKSQRSHMPLKKQKREHEYYDSGDEKETVEEFVKKDETKTQIRDGSQETITHPTEIQWTREEDRLLLEQMKMDMDKIAEIADRFPNKTQSQIKTRKDFLIDFLIKLRNKNN